METIKEIRLQGAVIHDFKCITKTPLTTINCTSQFDQITAEGMGIKDSLYDEQGQPRNHMKTWGPDVEMFGATCVFIPAQKALFGDKTFKATSVKIKFGQLLRQSSDSGMKLSFELTVAGYPRDLLDFCEAVQKGECGVVIDKPSKAVEDNAKAEAMNLGLFKQAKIKDPEEPKNEADDEPPPADPAENDEADMPIEEVEQVRELVAEAVTGSLPSMREMGGRPKLAPQRGRGRRHIPRGGTLPD